MKRIVIGVAFGGILAIWLEQGGDSMFLGLSFYPYWLTIILVLVIVLALSYSALVRLILRKPERIRRWNKMMSRIVAGELVGDRRIEVYLENGKLVGIGLDKLSSEQINAITRAFLDNERRGSDDTKSR